MMGITLLIGAASLSILVLPAITVFFIECAAALLHREPTERPPLSDRETPVRTAILVPAHNEESSIALTLSCVLKQQTDHDRVIAIADNCDDQTAAVARRLGAETIERNDGTRRGKGFALAFGIDHLRATGAPDVVIVVDADTHVEPGTIRALGRDCFETGRPIQAINVLSPPSEGGCRDQISAFAFRVRNLVRPLGQSMLGQPCQLMGTGMALPWSVLEKMELASSNLVEDMQLGIDFAVAGLPPRFNTAGKVTGTLPSSRAAATSQRKRWEHGHLATIITQAPQLLLAALRQRRFDLFWLALDLAVPPLALLVLMWLVMALLATAAALATGYVVPVAIAALSGGMLFSAVLVAWYRFATDIPMRALISVPFYVFQKLPIYLGFLRRRQVRWVRTERA